VAQATNITIGESTEHQLAIQRTLVERVFGDTTHPSRLLILEQPTPQ
jgi:hypothetical protein